MSAWIRFSASGALGAAASERAELSLAVEGKKEKTTSSPCRFLRLLLLLRPPHLALCTRTSREHRNWQRQEPRGLQRRRIEQGLFASFLFAATTLFSSPSVAAFSRSASLLLFFSLAPPFTSQITPLAPLRPSLSRTKRRVLVETTTPW